jgi:L-aminopeptidase/D-esterase-like protein
VPAAVVFDLGRGGNFRNRPDAGFGLRAAAAARRTGRRGAVGAGTGARAGGLQGGIGMASTTVADDAGDVTVAALAVVNASGSPVDPSTGLPWASVQGLRRPAPADRRALTAAATPVEDVPMNTTIGVVAVDARLSRAEVGRLAQSAHDGLARAIRPAHGLTDGDVIFGLATDAVAVPTTTGSGLVRDAGSRVQALNRIFAAAADVFAVACTDAILTASRVGDAPSYRDLCPSAFRHGAAG